MKYAALIAAAIPLFAGAQNGSWDWCIGQSGLMSDIATDAQCNAYAFVNLYTGGNVLGLDIPTPGRKLIKIGAGGEAEWAIPMTNIEPHRSQFSGEHIYFCGNVSGTYSFGNWTETVPSWPPTYFIGKFDLDGEVQWMLKGQGAAPIFTGGIAVNSLGEVFVAGHGHGSVVINGTQYLPETDSRIAYFWKVDPDGSLGWIRHGGCVAGGKTRAQGAAVDDEGNFYAVGYVNAHDQDCDHSPFGQFEVPTDASFFIVSLDQNGAFTMARYGSGAELVDIECVNDADLYLVGTAYANGTPTFEGNPWFSCQGNSGFIARFDADGEPIWHKDFSSVNGNAGAYRVLSTPGAVHVGCSGMNDVTIGGWTDAQAGRKLMHLKLSEDGSIQDLSRIGFNIASGDLVTTIPQFAGCENGEVLLSTVLHNTSGFPWSLSWDDQETAFPYSANHSGYFVIGKSNPFSTAVNGADPGQAPLLYPNPCNEWTTLEGTDMFGERVELFSAGGQLIRAWRIRNERLVIDTREIPSGLYFIRSTSRNAVRAQQLVVQH